MEDILLHQIGDHLSLHSARGGIHPPDDLQVQAQLVAEIAEDQALVVAGRCGDIVDAGASEAVLGKYLLGGIQDGFPGSFGIVRPAPFNFCFGHFCASIVTKLLQM